jgi:hypothetical protein
MSQWEQRPLTRIASQSDLSPRKSGLRDLRKSKCATGVNPGCGER